MTVTSGGWSSFPVRSSGWYHFTVKSSGWYHFTVKGGVWRHVTVGAGGSSHSTLKLPRIRRRRRANKCKKAKIIEAIIHAKIGNVMNSYELRKKRKTTLQSNDPAPSLSIDSGTHLCRFALLVCFMSRLAGAYLRGHFSDAFSILQPY